MLTFNKYTTSINETLTKRDNVIRAIVGNIVGKDKETIVITRKP